ncbi:putative reverse transcriptase domain-containing protein, partial [Tanacetum coccineum]
VELGRNLKLRLSDSNSLTAVSSQNFNSRNFPHRQPIYKEAVSSHLVLDCAFGGERHLLRSILAGQSTFLIPEIFQQLSNDNVAAVVAPSVSILEAHSVRNSHKRIMILRSHYQPDVKHIKIAYNKELLIPASGAKEVNTTIKESSRPERASVFAKRAPGRNLLPHQKPTPLRKVFSTFKKGIYCHINVDVGCGAMDNSLQAVWSNDQNDRRLKRVEVSEGNISIFDTGGEMGALLHRTSGSVRDPSGDELELSPGGSFTKCDDLSEGKTIMPIEFQVSLGLTLYSSIESLLHVNGEDLAEIPSVERTIGADAAFAMTWRELMKLMAEVYCLRNEIQKMESELWNLTVKNNDLAAYTQRFQELTMMCTKMVPEEEDQIEKFIGVKRQKLHFNY